MSHFEKGEGERRRRRRKALALDIFQVMVPFLTLFFFNKIQRKQTRSTEIPRPERWHNLVGDKAGPMSGSEQQHTDLPATPGQSFRSSYFSGIAISFGLSDCIPVPPTLKFNVEILTPGHEGIRRWWGHEGGAFRNRIRALITKGPRELRSQWEGGSELSMECHGAGAWTSHSPPPKPWRISFCCLSHPVWYFVTAAWTDEDTAFTSMWNCSLTCHSSYPNESPKDLPLKNRAPVQQRNPKYNQTQLLKALRRVEFQGEKCQEPTVSGSKSDLPTLDILVIVWLLLLIQGPVT